MANAVTGILNRPRALFVEQHPHETTPDKASSRLWEAGAYFVSCYSELKKCKPSTQTDYIEKGTCICFIHFI